MIDSRSVIISVGIGFVLTFSSFAKTPPESVNHRDLPIEKVYGVFRNPPAGARPFVRWWWNNNQIEEKEIIRELDVLKAAGIGGVEINPIEAVNKPEESKAKVLTWRSEEWDRVLLAACKGAKQRGMLVDIIAGSGWPFGGKFLKPEDQIMLLSVKNKVVNGGAKLELNLDELIGDKPVKISFVRIFPKEITSLDQVRDVTENLSNGRMLSIDLGQGEHVISCGFVETGFCEVVFGVPGADGPAMDHMQKNVTRAYLDRLRGVEKTWGEPISNHVRAIFCDSIEMMGSNWTHDMADRFLKRKGYDINPWLPFVMDHEHQSGSPELLQQIQRVRYDWSEHLVSVFLSGFTEEYARFCHDHGLLSRYQAYGIPWLMGLAEGYMIPDIPESNNWLYSQDIVDPMDPPYFTWNQKHGYMIWNKYASAAAHMRGKKVISSEAMTNTKKVFHTTLATIKQADDMNFITGITHSVLHGYNYVPPDVPFPGWIRFGTFFSERNTWWPYFSRWVDYNARLSSVFQESRPVVEVAVLGRTADHWSVTGLFRDPFHLEPRYLHRLWEPLSQIGLGSDYLHEAVFEKAEIDKGNLKIGPMTYKLLIVADAVSITPKTAQSIQRFVESGGKVVFVGSVPGRSPSLVDAEQNDSKVRSAIQQALKAGAVHLDGPREDADSNQLRAWTTAMLDKISFKRALSISSPHEALYSLQHSAPDAEILFFANTHRKETVKSRVDFALGESGLWRWNPETGERTPYDFSYDAGGFELHLNPLESVLLVTGIKSSLPAKASKTPVAEQPYTINAPWAVSFHPVNSDIVFEQTMPVLMDFTKSENPQIRTFSGTAVYRNTFSLDQTGFAHLHLGQDNDFISEIELNGEKLGVIWYGSRPIELKNALRKGENQLTIRYTTTLWNAMNQEKLQPSGLIGPVMLK